jgi:FAD binding domain-containing protein/berberine-like enzyme
MAIYRNRNREAKTHRHKNVWSKINRKVFKAMDIPVKRLEEFEHKLVGYVVLPEMPNYEQDRQEAMLTPYSAKPQIIVYCKAQNDVYECLKLANEFNIWVTCRSGGHSFAGYSVNTGMVIDLSNLNSVKVDPEQKRARIGPGAQFDLINSTLTYPYKLHLPGGTCPDVACAGYMQGGGYGLTARRFGMHCDSVLQITMMLYDGRIVVADEKQNKDLFWAVRGGTGNNFGVLLESEYQLYDLLDVWGFAFTWDIKSAPAVLQELQSKYMRTGRNTRLGFMPVLAILKGKPKLIVMGLYQGNEQDGTKSMQSILAIGKPEKSFSKIGPYADLNEAIFAVLPGIPTDPPQPMLARSGYISEPVDLAYWETICNQFAQTANPWNIIGIEPYGGAINDYPRDGNAFIHRDVDMDLFVFAFLQKGQEPADQLWLDTMSTTLSQVWNGHMYQNYPERNFPNFRWAYWGDAYESLWFVKQKYDPKNFFHFEQSITPYPADGTVQRSHAPSMFKDKKVVYERYSKSFLK